MAFGVRQLGREVSAALAELRADARQIGRYVLSTESHVFAFAIAANVLLSFWPFMLVLIALLRNVLGWPAAVTALYATIQDFFAGATGEFLTYNLEVVTQWRWRVEWLSLLLLLFTANGIFLPLEVALNRAWGVKENRSLLKNQAVSMGLIFVCGWLALFSAALTGAGVQVWEAFFGQIGTSAPLVIKMIAKAASLPVTILALFLIYVYLPNTSVPQRAILPRVVVVGLALELLKWINLAIWPWLFRKFDREFGVFKHSVTILTWSFLAALVVLAGAEWIAWRTRHAHGEAPVESGSAA
ncbi:MAG: YihY/virulence factor BrkB family protein [Bryobacteraceae bacterium]